MRTNDRGMPLVFIYCDDPSHDGRRVTVDVFCRVVDPEAITPVTDTADVRAMLFARRWQEVPRPGDRFTNPAGAVNLRGVEAGYMDGHERPLPDAPEDVVEHLAGDPTRRRFALVCRKCKGRPVPARAEKLYAVLDAFVTHGWGDVPLTLVAASLSRSSTPEPGQG
ncbi:hypothetical protein [Promicromonospora soli]